MYIFISGEEPYHGCTDIKPLLLLLLLLLLFDVSHFAFLRRDRRHKSFDFNIHLRLQKTSETSKSLENNILCLAIDLVMVFDAILMSMQTCEKLQCLYEKRMSSNFNKTAVLKIIYQFIVN